jgi:hypothetical protein
VTIEIPLNSKKYPGLVALVDDEDYELVKDYSWHPQKNCRTFYASATTRKPDGSKTIVHMHKLILPDAVQVDHIVKHNDERLDGLDNRRTNLRACTNNENQGNRRNQVTNTSGLKGVSWHHRASKWRSQIGINGKYKYLGLFDDPRSAAIAYDTVARIVFGEFACLNLPDVVMPVSLLPQAALKHVTEYLNTHVRNVA